MRDLKEVRADFPIFKDGKLIYLDSAATAHKPSCVIDAMSDFYANHYGTVHRAVYKLAADATGRYCAVREKVATFLNARFSDEIIFTKGTTDGFNLLAHSFGRHFLQKGDAIILSEMEHHANLVPWQQIAHEKGIELRFIPMDEKGELDLAIYKELLDSSVKLVSIAHIANSTGTKNPIEQMILLAHAVGAKFAVDGAQSAAHLKIDVQKLDADFFLFSGHKCFGPTGVGILYGKREILEQMPPYQTGGDMITSVHLRDSRFQAPPMRFEAGTPMIAEVIGLGAAIDYIESLGLDAIEAHEQKLLGYATEKLLAISGLRLLGSAREKGAICNFVIDGVHPLDVGTLLDLRGIAVRTGHLCAQPALRKFGLDASVRASFAPYNTLADIDFFITALTSITTRLR